MYKYLLEFLLLNLLMHMLENEVDSQNKIRGES